MAINMIHCEVLLDRHSKQHSSNASSRSSLYRMILARATSNINASTVTYFFTPIKGFYVIIPHSDHSRQNQAPQSKPKPPHDKDLHNNSLKTVYSG